VEDLMDLPPVIAIETRLVCRWWSFGIPVLSYFYRRAGSAWKRTSRRRFEALFMESVLAYQAEFGEIRALDRYGLGSLGAMREEDF
jgi:hypothetical protein